MKDQNEHLRFREFADQQIEVMNRLHELKSILEKQIISAMGRNGDLSEGGPDTNSTCSICKHCGAIVPEMASNKDFCTSKCQSEYGNLSSQNNRL